MSAFDGLPDGWTVWSDEPGDRAILAYRPDVFDSRTFPAPCLPTVYLTPGPRRRHPANRGSRDDADTWHVTLFLEPDVSLREDRTFDSREAAVEGAIGLAREFSRGEIDYRGLYQVPREEYLDRLDELVGRDT